jgi:hypothetical protein
MTALVPTILARGRYSKASARRHHGSIAPKKLFLI